MVEKQSPNPELEQVITAEAQADPVVDRRSVKALWSHAFGAFKERSLLSKVDHLSHRGGRSLEQVLGPLHLLRRALRLRVPRGQWVLGPRLTRS